MCFMFMRATLISHEGLRAPSSSQKHELTCSNQQKLLTSRFGSSLFLTAGSTSANAAEALGLKRVFSTDSPGLAGFVEAIESALASCQPASC